ncbi:hypothetical protein ACFOD0_05420 [Shewanella intestini]|uniref:DNA polymerase III subunit psi n=1 Tax=Shewanella intestini TaxID=2017544 RepID=A0ABS5I140_9GAMM|nr:MULTISPECIES: hypothetical protein [Shewanella]MBR9727741.1 hypothetical protein [Shewanella intestini]MRG35109.1 hypothetical protein [Shewanella sp. XMDDZSB0408]
MDKNAFLDAMNVSRWRSADTPGKPYLVLHDLDADMSNNQLLTQVLKLLNVDLEQCEFDCKPISGMQVVWDMRKVKMRPRVAWVVTSPLADILPNADEKQQLWQQVVTHLNQQTSESAAHA